MASVQTSSHDGRYLKLTVTQTKGTSEQNYSTINWTLESIGGSVNYYTIYCRLKPFPICQININK